MRGGGAGAGGGGGGTRYRTPYLTMLQDMAAAAGYAGSAGSGASGRQQQQQVGHARGRGAQAPQLQQGGGHGHEGEQGRTVVVPAGTRIGEGYGVLTSPRTHVQHNQQQQQVRELPPVYTNPTGPVFMPSGVGPGLSSPPRR